VIKKCNKECPRCCPREGELSHTGKVMVDGQAQLADWAKAVTKVLVALTICFAFLGILGFSCFAQYNKVEFKIDFALMSFFFLTLGTLIGVSAKELAQSIPKIGGGK
jgi:hypothetical protein